MERNAKSILDELKDSYDKGLVAALVGAKQLNYDRNKPHRV